MIHLRRLIGWGLLPCLALLGGCELGGGEEVPITTASSKAREYYLEGRDLAERLRRQEATEKFEQAIAADSRFAMAFLALAQSGPSTKSFFVNLDRAKSFADEVSEGERLQILASEAAASGDPEAQGQFLDRLVQLYPKDARVYDQLGNYYFGQQMYDSAAALYLKANQLAPDFSSPYNMLGYAYRFMGNYADAEKSFRKYMELIPDDPNPYDSYADLLLKMGRYEESIASYKKALDVSPGFPPSFVGTATNLNFLGQYREARGMLASFYAQAVDDGQRRTALLGTAVSYVDQGVFDSALVSLEAMRRLAQAIDDAASEANDLDLMGIILLHMDRAGEAAEKFSQSLAIIERSGLFPSVKDNARLDNIQRRALVAVRQDDLTLADSLANLYLRLSTEANNPFRVRAAHQALGMVALGEHDYPRAISELRQADQQQAYNLFRLAQAYEGAGDAEQALSLYRQVAQFNQLNSFTYALIRREAVAKATPAEQS